MQSIDFIFFLIFIHLQQYQNFMTKKKIFLNVYDLCQYNFIFQPCGLGIYHTGIQIDNCQYCFGRIDLDPNATGILTLNPQKAQYQFKQKILLGVTAMKEQDFYAYMAELQEQFLVGKYHVFTNNCNHFSDAMARKFLRNQTIIPNKIFRATNILSWLCCCLPEKIVTGRWHIERQMGQTVRKEFEMQELEKNLIKEYQLRARSI